jgi:hypothetical protein
LAETCGSASKCPNGSANFGIHADRVADGNESLWQVRHVMQLQFRRVGRASKCAATRAQFAQLQRMIGRKSRVATYNTKITISIAPMYRMPTFRRGDMSEPFLSWNPKFFQDLNSEDDIGLLIRSHLHVERAVREYIDQCVPFPAHLPRLTYSAAVQLACSLGLDDTYLAPLKALGKLRNHFGHNYEAELGETEIANLLASLAKEDRLWIAAAYESARHTGNIRGPQTFNELAPGNKFGLFVVALRTMLAKALDVSKSTDGAQE